MKTVVCFCLMLGATFVRGQDQPTTVSVDISTPADLALNETSFETMGMEPNVSETTSMTLINETTNGQDEPSTVAVDMSTPADLGLNETNFETAGMEANASETTSRTLTNETITPGSNPEITSSENPLTTTAVVQEVVTTSIPTESLTETSQPTSTFANLTDLGGNVTEDQPTTGEPASPETSVAATTNSMIPEVKGTTGESITENTQGPAETTVQPTTQELTSEETPAPESLTTSLETNVSLVAMGVAGQQTDTTHAAELMTTLHATSPTESNTSEQPQPTCSEFFECMDVPTIALILAFAAGAVFVVIVSFVICRKCIKSPPDGKYTLMRSSDSP